MSKVPLVTRKNIKDAEATNAEHLDRINKILGTEWTLEIDYPGLYEVIATEKEDYKDSVGDVTTWYFDALVGNIQSFVNKDALYKEALVEEVTANKIKAFKIVPNGSIGTAYNKIEIEDGAFVIVVPKQYIGTNVGDLAQDLEHIL